MHANNRRATTMTRASIDAPLRRAEQSALRTNRGRPSLGTPAPVYLNQPCRDYRCGPQILNSPAECIRLIRYSMPS
jgi:hypothetical protein